MNQQVNIDLSKTTEIVCEKCGSNKFRPIFFLRKLSRFMSPDGNDRVIPLDTLACLKCNHVNEEFRPAFTTKETESENNNQNTDGSNEQ